MSLNCTLAAMVLRKLADELSMGEVCQASRTSSWTNAVEGAGYFFQSVLDSKTEGCVNKLAYLLPRALFYNSFAAYSEYDFH